MTVEIIILILLVIFLKKFLFKSRTEKLLDKIPGPKSYPIIGNMLDFKYPKEDVAVTMQKMAEQYGPVYLLRLGADPVVCLTDPLDVEAVLNNKKALFKPDAFHVFHQYIKQGLFTSGGEEWRKQRKIIAPAFHLSILQSYVSVFEKSSADLLQKLSETKEEDIDVSKIAAEYSFDVIIETAMKYRDVQEKPRILEALDELTYIVAHRGFSLLQSSFLFPITRVGKRHNQIIKFLHKVTAKMIKERKSELSQHTITTDLEDTDTGEKKKKPFLDLLLEFSSNGARMSDMEIQMQVDTFMAAGYDTTQSAVSFALYCLSQNPEAQQLVYEEIKQIFGDSDREATYKDLQEMKYLENAIKESLRLYSTTRIVGRKSYEEIQLKSGFTIPKNISIFILAYAMHVDPKLFTEPLKFDPKRFENKEMHPYSHIPFGGGPRECIGKKFAMLSMKSVITCVLRKFILLPSDIQLQPWFDIILRSTSGIHIRVQKR